MRFAPISSCFAPCYSMLALLKSKQLKAWHPYHQQGVSNVVAPLLTIYFTTNIAHIALQDADKAPCSSRTSWDNCLFCSKWASR